MSGRFYLGIDGGQSSTKAAVCDQNGQIVAIASDGPCNHVSGAEAEEKFRRVIGGCVREVMRLAGVSHFAAACCGFSGGEVDKERLTREMIPADAYLITHDAEIALAGALESGSGVIVISGTGSIAFGKDANGRTARAGGWGYVFGDEGGAFDVARRAVRAAVATEEGWQHADALRHALLRETGFETANTMLHGFYTAEWPRSRVAKLALVVAGLAGSGNGSAQKILEDGAAALVVYAEGVRAQLFGDERCALSYVGGTFESSAFREAFERAGSVKFDVTAPKRPPVEGALLLALKEFRS